MEQVRTWVMYTCQQYRLAPPLDWLAVDGRTLCSLSEQQFSMFGQVSVGASGRVTLGRWKSQSRRRCANAVGAAAVMGGRAGLAGRLVVGSGPLPGRAGAGSSRAGQSRGHDAAETGAVHL